MDALARFEPLNPDSFNRFWNQYNAKVRGWLIGMGCRYEIAEELTQEVFLDISRHKKERFIDAPPTFLWKQATWKLNSWRRQTGCKENRTDSRDAGENGDEEEVTMTNEIKDDRVIDAEHKMLADERDTFIREAIEAAYVESRSMTSQSKVLFMERYIEEKEYDDIAADHRLPRTSVTQQVNNTRGKVDAFFKKRVDWDNLKLRETNKLSSKR